MSASHSWSNIKQEGFFRSKVQQMWFLFYSRAEKRDILNTVQLKNKQINGKVVSLDGVCAQTGIKISSPGRSVGILIIFLEFSLSPISDFPGSDLVLTEVISSMTKQPAEASLTFTTKFLCLHNPTWACHKHSNRIQGQWRLTPILALRRGVPVAGIGGHASHCVSSPTLSWIPNILQSQPDITVRPSGTNCSAVWSFCPRSKIAHWCVNTLHIRQTGTCTLCLQNSFYIFFL